ncbi:radical SAM protein [Myxococcota bacterium]
MSINLDISTDCNQRCRHCIDRRVTNTGRRLSYDVVRELLSWLVPRGLRSVILIGGGEPTLHPQFGEIVNLLKEHRLSIGIVSNGVRIQALTEVAPLLSSRDWMRLSLDAATDETFASLHGSADKNPLTAILDGIGACRARWSDFQLGYSFIAIPDTVSSDGSVDRGNLEEIPAAARVAAKYGFGYLSLKPYIHCERRNTASDAAYVENVKAAVGAARRHETESFHVVESYNLSALIAGQLDELKVQPRVCHANYFRLVFSPDGIYGCPLWRGYKTLRLTPMKRFLPIDPRNFIAARADLAESLDASKHCADTACIYHHTNWAIERWIENPRRIGSLAPDRLSHDDFF